MQKPEQTSLVGNKYVHDCEPSIWVGSKNRLYNPSKS